MSTAKVYSRTAKNQKGILQCLLYGEEWKQMTALSDDAQLSGAMLPTRMAILN